MSNLSFKSPKKGLKRRAIAVLANEHPASLYDQEHGDTAVLDNDTPEGAVLINEVALDDRGWAVIPFGDWPHEMGMQKFGREQAQAIADTFNGLAGRFRRAVCGLPIFKGHPDHPVSAIANQYPDKEEKGQIAAVEVRPNGLALKLVLSNSGADLVKKGWKFISPLWIGNLISKAGEAFRTYAPTELRSIGLVVKPNIPSPSLANAASAANQNKHPMNPKTLKLLGLAEGATLDQIDAAVTTLHANAGALANEQSAHTTAKQALTTAQGQVTQLQGNVTALTGERDTTRTALANERTARINDQLAIAIRTGKITEAEKATWKGRLEANFDAEVVVLGNAAPKVKTASEIPAMLKNLESQMRKDLENGSGGGGADTGKDACGLANSDISAMKPEQRRSRMGALVNEAMGKLPSNCPDGEKYNKGFANAKRDNPRLFGFTQADVTGA